MPDLDLAVARLDLDAEELARELEHAVDDGGELEVRPKVFLLQLVLGLAKALGPEPEVPLHQAGDSLLRALLRGEGPDLLELALRRGPGLGADVLQKGLRAVQRGHLLGHGDVGEGAVAQ